MELKIEGKIMKVLPVESGVSKAGKEWKKQTYILLPFTQYAKEMAYTIFGEERLETYKAKVNDNVCVTFDISSNEFNGKWFTSVNAYKVEGIEHDDKQMPSSEEMDKKAEEFFNAQPDPNSSYVQHHDDDLPF